MNSAKFLVASAHTCALIQLVSSLLAQILTIGYLSYEMYQVSGTFRVESIWNILSGYMKINILLTYA